MWGILNYYKVFNRVKNKKSHKFQWLQILTPDVNNVYILFEMWVKYTHLVYFACEIISEYF